MSDKAVNKTTSEFYKLGVKIVRYTDDFVIMAKEIKKEVIEQTKTILNRMNLKLNKEKTKTIHAKDEPFNFLGFIMRYDKDIYGRNTRYWNIAPSKNSICKIRERIKEILRSSLHISPTKLVEKLNEVLRGWLNYFNIKGVNYMKDTKREIRYYLNTALYRYYNRKSQRKSSMYGQYAFEVLVNKYKLIGPIKY